jgi:hypothetical protein
MWRAPAGSANASGCCMTHMSPASPPVMSVQTRFAWLACENAGSLRGNGSVAASTSSWLMATVRSSSGSQPAPKKSGHAQLTTYGTAIPLAIASSW